jgi:hypothetical protein
VRPAGRETSPLFSGFQDKENIMSNVVDFKEALLKKNDEQFEKRVILPNDFVKQAIAAGKAQEEKINQAIAKCERALIAWHKKESKKCS